MKIDRGRVYNKYDGHCAYCGRLIDFKKMQVDHMIPMHLGQPDCNIIENLMPSCRKCNHYKRGETVEGFRLLMRHLHKRLHAIYIVEVAVNFGMAEITPFTGKFYFETLQNL